MAKTRGAARRLTASGAPKHGTVAKRATGAAKQAAKAAKAKDALKNPRTGKQQRVVNRLRREAQRAASDAETARIQAMCDAYDAAMSSRPGLESDEELDRKSLSYFQSKLLPTLAATGIDDDKLTTMLDASFLLDSTKQQARAMLAKAHNGDAMEDAPAGELC